MLWGYIFDQPQALYPITPHLDVCTLSNHVQLPPSDFLCGDQHPQEDRSLQAVSRLVFSMRK